MLDKRINTLKKRLRKKPEKIDVRPRHPFLKLIEGWYTVHASLEDFPQYMGGYKYKEEIYKGYIKEYKNSNSNMKFTRWLARKGVPNDELAKIGELLQDVTFKISCKHNDLLRLSETSHYTSCFREWRGIQQLRYLADEDIAVVFVPDKAGKFVWRALIRLMRDPIDNNKFVFLLHRSYGNSNEPAIKRQLNSITQLYVPGSRYTNYYGKPVYANDIMLESASVHNNNIVGIHVWSDHWCVINPTTKRINMMGKRFDCDIVFKQVKEFTLIDGE